MRSKSLTVFRYLLLVIFCLNLTITRANAAIQCEHCTDSEVEFLSNGKMLYHCIGDALFLTETARISCDSAVWSEGNYVRLNGNVRIDDEEYYLVADSTYFDIERNVMIAQGEVVELWSYKDSIYTIGHHVIYNRANQYLFMDDRPLLYLKYPDTANMVEVLADTIEYISDSIVNVANAFGNVVISSQEFSSSSGRAIMDVGAGQLELFDNPSAQRDNSDISGDSIRVAYEDDLIRSIVVIDSAIGNFKEPVDSLETKFDESILSGQRIVMLFKDGLMSEILCTGQAYSWYYPSPRGGRELHENSVSGDSIRFQVNDEKLESIDVTGGAIGSYISGSVPTENALIVSKSDSVNYEARYIHYNVQDSLIILREAAGVTSGDVKLSAYEILFNTKERIVTASSALVTPDTLASTNEEGLNLQPNAIPVVLGEGDDLVFGDFLEYSIDTKKGRVIRSKSSYDAGFYYGQNLFREQKNIYYVEHARYTTCDLAKPHYHFRSHDMKLIEGEKLIARPVVFYLGRIPLVYLPYYVFPLKKGRHSGFLPFTFGNFERGVRYVRNVGYYWAASEYWDWNGSFDYYENNSTFTLNSKLTFAKRYVVENTYLSGSFTRKTSYNNIVADEGKRDRWAIKGAYNHKVTPTFKVAASGEFQSDKSYFTDYSPNLEERLNRELRSKMVISKQLGEGTSLTGTLTHTVNLDTETRTDNIPLLSASLPVIYPFGNGHINDEGKLEQKWYQNIKFRYSPSLLNFSSRVTRKTLVDDSTYTTHPELAGMPGQGVYPPGTMDVDELLENIGGEEIGAWAPFVDTLSWRSRKKFLKLVNSPTLYLPTIAFGNYINIIPSFSYREEWFKIIRTDQSDNAGVDPGVYRTYSWNAGVTANTKLYGTLRPNLYGLMGLRHVVIPSVRYSYTPDIDRNPTVRRYAGGGAGSKKSSRMAFTLGQDFQAKVNSGGEEHSLELFTLKSSFSYDYEADSIHFSDLVTTYQSRVVPNLNISGQLRHSFYETGTANLNYWSPNRQSFTFNATMKLKGIFPLFDEPSSILKGVDSVSKTESGSSKKAKRSGGSWGCTLNYRYGESGRDETWRKTQDILFIQINVNFKLTPSTAIAYAQRYDFRNKKTINNSVSIVRKIHCWTGSLHWVPVGSNRGFGFKLCVTDLPEIKIDNGHDDFLTGLQRYR